MARATARLCAACCLLGWALACDDLGDFRTGENEVFRGLVLGSEPEDAGASDTPARPFLLHGFDSAAQMELRFDPRVAGSAAADRSPGTIDTYVCDDPAVATCSAASRTPGPLRDAPLLPVAGLAEDVLNRYDFPGASRVRNYIFHAPLSRGESSEHAMVFLSLMESGRVEVRVIAPATGQAGPLFGIFRLGRATL